MNSATLSAPGEGGVSGLLARRADLQRWLQRLEENAADVPARVTERVRADYQARLDQTVSALSQHIGQLRAELAQLREQLDSATERHQDAADALDEARLRHRIGELSGEEWEERRETLEERTARAASERQEAAEQVTRLEEILAQIEAAPTEQFLAVPERPEAPLPAVESEADPPSQERLTRDELEPAATPAAERDATTDGDLAFLEELDRAITATAPAADAEEPTRPLPGVKCADCGYTNDANAWYCGVCGMDLA